MMWARAVVASLLGAVVFWASPAPAAPEGQIGEIVGVSVSGLDLYDAPGGKRVETLPAAGVALPLPVLRMEPNKRLKVRFPDGRVFWVEGHHVRTRGIQKSVPCDPGPSRHVTALAPRGLEGGCR